MASQKRYKPLSELISLAGKKAIVTGGAAGIGFAITYRLAEAGATVALVDTNTEKGEKASQELASYGYQAFFLPCDVSQEEDVQKAVGLATEKMGGVDILVNNAGIFPCISLTQTTAADFERVMAVNLKGLFLFSREVSRRMIEQKKGGCIINIASIDAIHPCQKGLSAYDASKGGVLTLTKSMALELGRYDIRVNAIAPGGILTEGVLAQRTLSQSEESRSGLRAFMARIPLGKMGVADDIGRIALFLASELSSYMTGSLIVADGGYLVS